MNICKWGLNNFRLFLCLSSGLVLKWMRSQSSLFFGKSQKKLHTNGKIHKGWDEKRMNLKANEINLIIKNPHKMNWSLKMPFVLSLSCFSFYAAFTLRLSHLLVLCCAFIIFSVLKNCRVMPISYRIFLVLRGVMKIHFRLRYKHELCMKIDHERKDK